VVKQVLEHWQTAPVRPQVHAALGFLEKLIKQPETLAAADVRAVYEAGVSREALERAVYVCVGFTMIVRVADAFAFEISTPEEFDAGARMLMKRGYII